MSCPGFVHRDRRSGCSTKTTFENKGTESTGTAGQKTACRESADTELRWNPRKIPDKSKGFPEISSWHTGTAGILPSDAAEISLVNPSRIGFSRKTELLFRIAEEPILPNIGLKHLWWANKRFCFGF